MKTIKNKLISSLICGVIATTIALFLFIQHGNKTITSFLFFIGLVNYLIFAVLTVMYFGRRKRVDMPKVS